MQCQLKNSGYKTALAGNKYLNQFSGKPPYFDLAFFRAGYYNLTGLIPPPLSQTKRLPGSIPSSRTMRNPG